MTNPKKHQREKRQCFYGFIMSADLTIKPTFTVGDQTFASKKEAKKFLLKKLKAQQISQKIGGLLVGQGWEGVLRIKRIGTPNKSGTRPVALVENAWRSDEQDVSFTRSVQGQRKGPRLVLSSTFRSPVPVGPLSTKQQGGPEYGTQWELKSVPPASFWLIRGCLGLFRARSARRNFSASYEHTLTSFFICSRVA